MTDNSASLEKPEPMRCPTCGDVSTVRYENIGNCKDAWHDPDSPAPSSSPLKRRSPDHTTAVDVKGEIEFIEWIDSGQSSPKPPELRHTCVEPDNDMEEQYCAACENLSIADWVVERHGNCIRIAGEKTGLDRDGWLNDAHYFRQIIESLRATPSAEPKPADSPDMVWVNRAEYNSLRECMIEAADEIQRLRTPSPEPPSNDDQRQRAIEECMAIASECEDDDKTAGAVYMEIKNRLLRSKD